VVPQCEVWGFSEVAEPAGRDGLVAMETGHPKACLLPDVYHLYKGGSDFTGLKLLECRRSRFHLNEATDRPAAATIADKDLSIPAMACNR